MYESVPLIRRTSPGKFVPLPLICHNNSWICFVSCLYSESSFSSSSSVAHLSTSIPVIQIVCLSRVLVRLRISTYTSGAPSEQILPRTTPTTIRIITRLWACVSVQACLSGEREYYLGHIAGDLSESDCWAEQAKPITNYRTRAANWNWQASDKNPALHRDW